MKKYLAFLAFVLIGGLTYAQTTVTLEDQCDCQVLSGTAVTSAGQSSPNGSEAGDIYVNTDSGTIFYWDGDSWELTSSDDQQLQRFEYNNTTSILTLEIEGGNTLTVDLSVLNNSGSDNQNATQVPFDNSASGLAATDVQAALDALDTRLDGDLDTDPSNELNSGLNLNNGLLEITDNGGTLSQSLISLDANNNILAGSDGGLYLNFAALQALSTLSNNGDGTFTYTDEDGTVTNIDIRATNINYDGTTSGLTATDVQSALDEVAANVAADGDTDSTNELNTGFGVNGVNLEITDNGGVLQVPLSAITAGVNTDDQNLIGATLDGSNILQIDIEDGASTSVDLSSLEESGDISANTALINTNTSNIATNTTGISTNAGSISTNSTNIATNTSGISTNATNIATNTTDIATNASGISTNATNIATNTTDIATNATDIANHVAADGDLSSSNELITGFAVNGSDLEITEAGTVFQVPLTDIVSGVNTDNQNLTGATLNGSNVLQIDIEDGTSTTVDLSSLEESAAIAANTTAINTNTTNIATNTSDISTNATNIATNTTDIATNATDIANHIAADGDTNIGNEYNTGSGISAGSIQITDGGGTESINLVSADANNDIAVGSDGALYLNVASVSISETITNLTDNGNGTFTYVNENGVSQVINKSTLVDNLDGTYTFNNGSGPVVITNTDNQNLTGASLNGSNVLQIDIEDGSSATVDLSSLEESAAIAANTTAINTNTTNIATNTSGISTNATNIATNTTDIATNASGISTNATNIATNTTDIATNATDIANHVAADGDLSSSNELITGFAVNGSDLEITEAGTVFQVPLTDIVSGVNTDNQNLTGATLNGSNVLQIDIEDGSSATVDLSSLEESAAIAANTTAINTNTTNIATNTSDISTNATNIATNTTDIATNATDIANHIAADGDTNIGNEYNTGSGISAGSIQITDGGGTESINLVSADANNDIAVGSDGALYLNVASVSISETITNLTDNGNGTFTYVNENGVSQVINKSTLVDNLDGTYTFNNGSGPVVITNTDNQNLTGASLNGSNVLQIDIEDGSSATVDLSSLEESAAIAANTTAINTNTTNIATNTSDISTNAGNISTNATNIATNTT